MKRPPRNGDEQDALTGWKNMYRWRPGERKKIKRRANKRERSEAKRIDWNDINDVFTQ